MTDWGTNDKSFCRWQANAQQSNLKNQGEKEGEQMEVENSSRGLQARFREGHMAIFPLGTHASQAAPKASCAIGLLWP